MLVCTYLFNKQEKWQTILFDRLLRKPQIGLGFQLGVETIPRVVSLHKETSTEILSETTTYDYFVSSTDNTKNVHHSSGFSIT